MFVKDTEGKTFKYLESKCTFNSIPFAILWIPPTVKNIYLGDSVGGTGSSQKHLDTCMTAADIHQWNQQLAFEDEV